LLEQVADRIYRLKCPHRVDLWVYCIVDELIALVDSGLAGPPLKEVFSQLKRIGVKPEQIDLVINTHEHWDHIGGNNEVIALSGAKVYAHRLAAPWIENHQLQWEEFWNRYPSIIPRDNKERELFFQGVGMDTRITSYLEDGSLLKLGQISLQVIHTPGHSQGSICLYEPKAKILITGDAIQGRGTPSQGLPLYDHVNSYLSTLNKLSSLEINLMLTSHYEVLSRDAPQKLIAESREQVIAIEGYLTQFLIQDGKAELPDLAAKVCRQMGNQGLTLAALITVEAHLRNKNGH
jgi:glyoxylase-like metal-dependent hydrolase (beta-lactamase superfamily II)